MHIPINTHTHTHTYTHTHICTGIHIHTHVHTHKHTHSHTQWHVQVHFLGKLGKNSKSIERQRELHPIRKKERERKKKGRNETWVKSWFYHSWADWSLLTYLTSRSLRIVGILDENDASTVQSMIWTTVRAGRTGQVWEGSKVACRDNGGLRWRTSGYREQRIVTGNIKGTAFLATSKRN